MVVNNPLRHRRFYFTVHTRRGGVFPGNATSLAGDEQEARETLARHWNMLVGGEHTSAAVERLELEREDVMGFSLWPFTCPSHGLPSCPEEELPRCRYDEMKGLSCDPVGTAPHQLPAELRP